MALKDMAYTKADQKAKDKGAVVPYEPSKYPYGLSVRLEQASLKKLGLSSLPKVGTKMKLTAEVEVVSTSQREERNGEDSRCLELQITKMDLGKNGVAGAVDKAIEETYE